MRWRRSGFVAIVDEFLQQRAALREDLIDVPVGALHCVEDLGDVRFRHRLMKKIAHRVDKNHAGLFPVERLHEAFRPDGEIKTVFEGVSRHAAEAFGEAGGIAIIAAGTDLCATGHGVPGRIGPLYGAFFRHDSEGPTAGIAK
jgi:hypothetical protein